MLIVTAATPGAVGHETTFLLPQVTRVRIVVGLGMRSKLYYSPSDVDEPSTWTRRIATQGPENYR